MINTKTGKAGLHIQGVHAPSSNGKSFSLSTICDRKLNVTAQKNDIMGARARSYGNQDYRLNVEVTFVISLLGRSVIHWK